MSYPEIPNQPLLADRNQAANAQGGRSSRAYKLAGLTLLASVLIVGQALTVYFVLSQKSDIKSLQEQSNHLDSELTKSRTVAVPMRMPMNAALSNMMDLSLDEGASTKDPQQTVPQQATVCQLEAAGVKPVQLPGFRPACDERGLYRVQQCFMDNCWCVNPADGEQLPGSLSKGKARCGASVHTGSLSKLLDLDSSA